ncbi:hypothetical protein ZIOFF_003633 [Zingiber officinale]|uniref:Uncharacterized protein n=1 Tax=Zingiber officinale TaxID=94328 RepID=A0A8J5I901_ZINOF|nr:hypothetical protein ZIOFF_003633 [Zingiber officinale]
MTAHILWLARLKEYHQLSLETKMFLSRIYAERCLGDIQDGFPWQQVMLFSATLSKEILSVCNSFAMADSVSEPRPSRQSGRSDLFDRQAIPLPFDHLGI